VVVGDFNAVSASIGFENITAAGPGYRPAAEYCGGWRGTWPFPLPMYDIDHALVRGEVAVTASELFSGRGLGTDHRGQFVQIALPPGKGAPVVTSD
jgi:endonuclease/exonuclease/phosphatase family metal-dependent hydrolase